MNYANTAVYSPFAYLPYLVCFPLANLFTSNLYAIIIVCRLGGIATFIAVAALCIRHIPFGKWPLACFCLIPQTLATISTVTADLTTLTASLTVLSALFFIANRGKHASSNSWLALMVGCIFLALAKPGYFVIIGLALLLPFVNKDLRERRFLALIGGIVALSAIAFLLWYLLIHNINTGTMWGKEIDPQQQRAFILAHPLHYLKLVFECLVSENVFSFGREGITSFHSPLANSGWITAVCLIIGCILPDRRERIGDSLAKHAGLIVVCCAFLFVTISIIICTALYLQFTTVGYDLIQGVQERYFLPLVPLIVLPIALLAGILNERRIALPAGSRLVLCTNESIETLDSAAASTQLTPSKDIYASAARTTLLLLVSLLCLAELISLMSLGSSVFGFAFR